MLDQVGNVVVDTNVLVHAANENDQFFEDSQRALDQVLEYGLGICVDEEYIPDPARNSSFIGYEYLEHVGHGSYGYMFLLAALEGKRIKQVCKQDYTRFKRIFRQMVRNNADIIFLSVAMATDKLLVSNDYEDMQAPKRKHWYRTHRLLVKDASEV